MAFTFSIRPYHASDVMPMAVLFRQTVRSVGLSAYTQQQVEAWATEDDEARAERWASLFPERATFIAESENGELVGFADAKRDGYLDHLFVHHLYQRRGIATALHTAVELDARRSGVSRLLTHASLIARPFFHKMGYVQLRQQVVTIRGVPLTNFSMEKCLGAT